MLGLKILSILSVVVISYHNPSTWKAEAGGLSQFQGQYGLHSKAVLVLLPTGAEGVGRRKEKRKRASLLV